MQKLVTNFFLLHSFRSCFKSDNKNIDNFSNWSKIVTKKISWILICSKIDKFETTNTCTTKLILLLDSFFPAERGPSMAQLRMRRSWSCCRRRCRSSWWSVELPTLSSGSWSGCREQTRCGKSDGNSKVKRFNFMKNLLVKSCFSFSIIKMVCYIARSKSCPM